MARILGLQVILEGTIRRTSGRTSVTARLADVHSGKLIWADSYEAAGDPGKEVAQAMATQVGAHLAIHGQFKAEAR